MQGYETDKAPNPAGSYSQVTTAGSLAFTAGFGPQDPATGEVPDGVARQTAQVLRNVDSALRAAGTSLESAVKCTVHLQDLHRDFAEFDAAYREFFTSPFPVRTTVGSTLANILVEIDVVAELPERRTSSR